MLYIFPIFSMLGALLGVALFEGPKNRLELIDGERLRLWLADYLDLDAV